MGPSAGSQSKQAQPVAAGAVAHLWQQLAVHHTPKHSGRLNRAEIDLRILSSQCLARRLPDIATLTHQTAARERDRDARTCTITWRFTTPDAPIKLHRLSPSS